MLVYSVILFAVAALFGLYMIARILGGQLSPCLRVIVPGLFLASGLLILLYNAFIAGHPPTAILVAAVLLLIAALGGFALLSFQLRRQVPPKPMAAIHALGAVAGFLTLCGSVFGVI